MELKVACPQCQEVMTPDFPISVAIDWVKNEATFKFRFKAHSCASAAETADEAECVVAVPESEPEDATCCWDGKEHRWGSIGICVTCGEDRAFPRHHNQALPKIDWTPITSLANPVWRQP